MAINIYNVAYSDYAADTQQLEGNWKDRLCQKISKFFSNASNHPSDLSNTLLYFKDLASVILSYLTHREIRAFSSVCRSFQRVVDNHFHRGCIQYGIARPPAITAKNYLIRFPDAIGIEFFQEYLGEVDNIPIPQTFLNRSQPGFKLVFIPESITIEVDENSPLILDESTAIDEDKARLKIEQEKENQAPIGRTKKIKVPLTYNNITFLARRCLKKNIPHQFGGYSIYVSGVIEQEKLGNIGISQSHWSYQKNKAFALNRPYLEQKEYAKMQKLEIVPFLDRFFFHIFSYIQTQKPPSIPVIERTSPLAIGWWLIDMQQSVLYPFYHKVIKNEDISDPNIGAAVQVSNN